MPKANPSHDYFVTYKETGRLIRKFARDDRRTLKTWLALLIEGEQRKRSKDHHDQRGV